MAMRTAFATVAACTPSDVLCGIKWTSWKGRQRRMVAMRKWLTRIRGAVGIGLTWAAEWAVAGLAIGVASLLLPGLPWHWFFEVFDAPLPALAVPGFFGGIFFSIVLGIAGRHRRFDELSLPVFAAWGALGGLLLTLFPLALSAVGLATLNVSPWPIIAAIGGPFILLGAASATITLMLARRSARRAFAGAGEDEAQLSEGEARELAGRSEPPVNEQTPASHGARIRTDAVRDSGDA
jgi:hypothetical protein